MKRKQPEKTAERSSGRKKWKGTEEKVVVHEWAVENKKYTRPAVQPFDAKEKNVEVMGLETDTYTIQHSPSVGPVAVVRVYGNTMDGHSVCVHIDNFLPYFYVAASNLNMSP